MPAESLGSPLAIGYTAEVYARGETEVLKLFRTGVSRRTAEYEACVAEAVRAAGLPVPDVGSVVEIEGRHGITYERVSGPTMLELVASRPWRLFGYARLLAELQAGIHVVEGVQGVPDQRTQLERKIREAEVLPNGLRPAVLRMLAGLPEDNRLCHGDFHPGNVVMTENGPVIIDWIDATNGYPLSDVARSSLLIAGAPVPGRGPRHALLARLRQRFDAAYRRHYFRLCTGRPHDIGRWRVVNAAARLSEGVPEERALLHYVQAALRG